MRPEALCVFCGSRFGAESAYREAAERLGRLMAERGVRLVYGGGSVGLMGALAESVLAAGGHVTGIIPEFLIPLEGKEDVSEIVVVDSMQERKQRMFERSDAFVVLPGGIGTLDEAFEAVSWAQLGLGNKPVVMVNVGGYWDAFERLVERVVAGGFAAPSVRDLFAVVGDAEAVFPALEAWPAPRGEGNSRKL